MTRRLRRPGGRAADPARLIALALGHLVLDVNQGVLVILVPVIRVALDTTIGMAAILVGAWTLVSSVLQPVFGALSDRHAMPWLVPLGVCVAGFGIALAGLAPAYDLAVLGVVLGGAGTAAFHPEAASRVAGLARRWRATGISYLSVGGNAGYALGVLVAAPLLVTIGRSAIAWLALPGLTYCLLTLGLFARSAAAPPSTGRFDTASQPVPVRAMARLIAVVAVRSTTRWELPGSVRSTSRRSAASLLPRTPL